VWFKIIIETNRNLLEPMVLELLTNLTISSAYEINYSLRWHFMIRILRRIEWKEVVALSPKLRCYNNQAPNVSRHPPHCLCIKLFKVQYLQNYPSKQDNLPLILKLVSSLILSHRKCDKNYKKRQIIWEIMEKVLGVRVTNIPITL